MKKAKFVVEEGCERAVFIKRFLDRLYEENGVVEEEGEIVL